MINCSLFKILRLTCLGRKVVSKTFQKENLLKNAIGFVYGKGSYSKYVCSCIKHHKNSPEWLQNLITYNKSERTLNLNQLPFKSSYGKRSFSRTGPRMWNLLPTKLKNLCETVKFKKGLKTFLFEGCDRFLEKLYEC